MTPKLKLSIIPDDRPVKITVELSAAVHRDLVAYAEILGRTAGDGATPEPAKLVAPMLQRFMTTDKGFRKAKQANARKSTVDLSGTES